MSADEAGRTQELLSAALDAMEFGIGPVTPEAIQFFGQIQTSIFLFTDEELVTAMMAPHLNHTGDNIEKLTEMYAKQIPMARAAAVERNLALPSGE